MKIALYALVHAKSLQPCPTLCDPMDCSPPVHTGCSRQVYWSGLPCPPPGDLPDSESEPTPPQLQHCRPILYCWAAREAHCSLWDSFNNHNNNRKCYTVGKEKSNLRKWFQIKLTSKYDCESYLKWITDPNVKVNITTFEEENIEIIVTLK